jgi:hypothetical protein
MDYLADLDIPLMLIAPGLIFAEKEISTEQVKLHKWIHRGLILLGFLCCTIALAVAGFVNDPDLKLPANETNRFTLAGC